MSRSRAKGTAWETTIVDYLRGSGATHAERRALGGTKDRGDIAGLPGLVIEAKAEAVLNLAGWVYEAEVERVNDGADLAVVWHKRRGKSSAGDGYVTMTGATLVQLLRAAGYIPGSSHHGEEAEPVRGRVAGSAPPEAGAA